MDTVFFIINDKEVYVCDYYKEQIKSVKFKDKDFWEVYDLFDFKELIEHMNYPLNYNRFKGNKINILYTDPRSYEMLFELGELFSLSLGVGTGILIESLLTYCKSKEHFGKTGDYYVSYGDIIYKVTKDHHNLDEIKKCNEEELDKLDETENVVIEQISTDNLCMHLIESQKVFLDFEERILVLSPVKLEMELEDNKKQSFLETHYKIEEPSLIKDGLVEKGDTLFNYTQYVSKLFGRKQKQVLTKKAHREGHFFSIKRNEQIRDGIWAEKGELIGVIGKKEDTYDSIKKWVQEIGF